jgi:hypothetical protein
MFTKIFFPALFSLIILLPAKGQEQDSANIKPNRKVMVCSRMRTYSRSPSVST